MRRFFTLVLVIFVLSIAGCGNNEVRRESASKIEDRNDLIYIIGEPKPYTGVLYETGDNGKLSAEATYKNGMLNGLKKKWDESGALITEEYYKNNLQHGLCKIWSPKGFILMEATFKNGRGNGRFRKWNDEGIYLGEAMYKDGKLVE